MRVAESQYPNLFGGIILTDGASHIGVYLTVLDPIAERNILGPRDPREFSFFLTATNVGEQEAIVASIQRDREALRVQGINIARLGTDVASGRVSVGVVGLTQAEGTYLRGRYGNNVAPSDLSPSDAVIQTSPLQVPQP